MQSGRGRGVFQWDFLAGVEVGRCAKGGQGGFVKTTEDEFAFARVVVDVAHRKNAWCAGGKVFRVHVQLFFRHVQAPISQGPQLGRQAQQHPKLIAGQWQAGAFGRGDVQRRQTTG